VTGGSPESGRAKVFREFVAREIEPSAGDWDRQEHMPRVAIRTVADAGHLATFRRKIPFHLVAD
jgi:hypothetical protein